MPLDEALPPDLVRLSNPVPSEAMKCGIKIPPESVMTTRHGRSAVTIFGRASSLGSARGGAAWRYEIELVNEGRDIIQLMTRHILVTSPDGTVEEVKGAGAGGQLPLLAPGESHTVTGTTVLHAAYGAMHGSYQFEVPSEADALGEAFSANMARFALSTAGRSELVPCSPEADLMSRMLPPTSVYNSYRVMVGATVEYTPAPDADELSKHAFTYHVEIINGRELPIVLHGRQWTFLDASGEGHSKHTSTPMDLPAYLPAH